MKFILSILLLAVSLLAPPVFALETKRQQLSAMEAFLTELDTHYGMAQFKYDEYGLVIDGLRSKYTRLINEARTLEEEAGFSMPKPRDILSRVEFQQLMIGMIAELRDGHVNNGRQNKESYGLGLVSAMIQGRLYVTDINKDLINRYAAAEEIKRGDEVLKINHVPVARLTEQRMLYQQNGTFDARQMGAMESLLTASAYNNRVPKEGDTVVVEFGRGDKTFEAHLNWLAIHDFQSEKNRHNNSFDMRLANIFKEDVEAPFGVAGTVRSLLRKGLLAKKLPPGSIIDIGEIVNSEISTQKKKTSGGEASANKSVESTTEESSADQARLQVGVDGRSLGQLTPVKRLQAYVVRHQGKMVAVLRIPSYNGAAQNNELAWIGEVLNRFQNIADVVVLDVGINSGGSVYYTIRLLEMLMGQPSMRSVQINSRLSETLAYSTFTTEARRDSEKDRPLNWGEDRLEQLAQEELERMFKEGKKWTGLKPAFTNLFLKQGPGLLVQDLNVKNKLPWFVVSDRRSASGGDFVPAEAQSNGILVFGDTSKGLGGPVYRSIDSMPGSEMSFRCTSGYCQRSDGWPIEGVGTVPNLYREIGHADLMDDFKDYADDILTVAVNLVDKKGEDEIKKALTERYDKRAKDEAAEKRIKPLADLLEKFRKNTAFTNAEADLNAGAADLQRAYGQLSEELTTAAKEIKDLKPEDWRRLIFPIPNSLLMHDRILSTLWRRDEVRNRLKEMQNVPRLQDKESILDLSARLAEVLKDVAMDMRMADPCDLWLTAKANFDPIKN
ncbi:MAG: S41 family peptidase [Bdellovibrionales bacterium]